MTQAQKLDVQAFRELFKENYGYIDIYPLGDKFFLPYVEMIEKGRSIESSLDLCQDGIMSQGLCDYQE